FSDKLKTLPYLFVGKAMLWYSLNQHKINCYTHFCQLFFLECLQLKNSTNYADILSESTNKFVLSQLPKTTDLNLTDDL
ncbi:unnamed protein product, partial [Rotaria magnacalcarata]